MHLHGRAAGMAGAQPRHFIAEAITEWLARNDEEIRDTDNVGGGRVGQSPIWAHPNAIGGGEPSRLRGNHVGAHALLTRDAR